MRRRTTPTSAPESLEHLIVRSELAIQEAREILNDLREHALRVSANAAAMRQQRDRHRDA